jgi:aspartate carbamoyltransferase regulatory subunit
MSQPKRPETIEGYIIPDNTNCINQDVKSVYKTFTEGQKIKKNEKFGNNIGIENY